MRGCGSDLELDYWTDQSKADYDYHMAKKKFKKSKIKPVLN